MAGSPEASQAAGIADRELLDSAEWHRTARAFSEHSTDRRYFTGLGPMIGFDAFHVVEQRLIQPVQVIVAGCLCRSFSSAEAGPHSKSGFVRCHLNVVTIHA